MPRITALYTGSARGYGTHSSDRIYGLSITRDVYDDMKDALEADHPCNEPQTCDIARMVDMDLIPIAVNSLFGATEAEECTRVLAAHRFNHTSNLAQFEKDMEHESGMDKEWYDWFKSHHVECPHCGSCLTFDDDEGIDSIDSCGNCAGEITDEMKENL